ncbi:sugar kinase, ribokinase [Pseudarthrobacter phenanthrenivorans Sphe3]|uniref:Sugar kinase, ribokinase n=1 Tax=Pseudarthrobacter phenanthrenivorans (strain DSM 18606 / JCM 16027 / LMG 23796 / Sphe3) TaxID=930171 RepID=F0M1F8_PSEPM|nr:carbohydrate kinase [Pseudarthrobacter phenanthrenivorans]ADX74154.1 sugar kinase, ribokinase [Pseudarthrobacter phenanthrenivorans Sphe3]
MPAVQQTDQDHTARFDVVVVGEALVDIVVSPRGTVEHPGGSPANVAYGLGRLGLDTGLLTSIGNDHYAALIEDHLRSAGVTLLPGSCHQGGTATATAVLASDGSAQYDFDVRWDLPRIAPATLPKILHTGSIATFLAPGAAVVRELLEQSHQRCVVTYDPNIRPSLLGSHLEAKTVFEELVPFTDVVKLSDEDAGWLYPRLSLEDTARRILGLGPRLVAVTRGAEGSLLATRDARVDVPSVPSVVADTIGAGDSYMSALIYGLLMRGAEGLAPSVLESLGRMAAKAAAITVRRPGAHPPTSEELQADLPEHQPVAL